MGPAPGYGTLVRTYVNTVIDTTIRTSVYCLCYHAISTYPIMHTIPYLSCIAYCAYLDMLINPYYPYPD